MLNYIKSYIIIVKAIDIAMFHILHYLVLPLLWKYEHWNILMNLIHVYKKYLTSYVAMHYA